MSSIQKFLYNSTKTAGLCKFCRYHTFVRIAPFIKFYKFQKALSSISLLAVTLCSNNCKDQNHWCLVIHRCKSVAVTNELENSLHGWVNKQ